MYNIDLAQTRGYNTDWHIKTLHLVTAGINLDQEWKRKHLIDNLKIYKLAA